MEFSPVSVVSDRFVFHLRCRSAPKKTTSIERSGQLQAGTSAQDPQAALGIKMSFFFLLLVSCHIPLLAGLSRFLSLSKEEGKREAMEESKS